MSTFSQQTRNRDLVPTHPRDATKCDTTAQNLSYVVSSSLLNHILHWICFKILFTYSAAQLPTTPPSRGPPVVHKGRGGRPSPRRYMRVPEEKILKDG